jgi:hypothetical protein
VETNEAGTAFGCNLSSAAASHEKRQHSQQDRNCEAKCILCFFASLSFGVLGPLSCSTFPSRLALDVDDGRKSGFDRGGCPSRKTSEEKKNVWTSYGAMLASTPNNLKICLCFCHCFLVLLCSSFGRALDRSLVELLNGVWRSRNSTAIIVF